MDGSASFRALIEKEVALDREILRRRARDKHCQSGGLYAFVKYFWHVLEPKTKFLDGWAIKSICDHLEGVANGDINRLLVNVPPGFAKSLLCNVFFPAWLWGPMKRPHMRIIAFSYAAHLTQRDNGKFRDLVCCADYQDLYGAEFSVVAEGVVKISNNKTGWKFASSVGGVGTGERADLLLCDDGHNIADGESEVIRSKTVRWFDESMSNRLNDLNKSAIVVIMQRVHECLLPHSEILSDMGTIRADEVRAGDPVLTSHGIQKVVAVASRDYVGAAIGIRSAGYCEELWVTSNHPILTTSGWVQAGDLTTEHVLVVNVDQGETSYEDLRRLWPAPDLETVPTFKGTVTGERGRVSREDLQALVDEGLSSRLIAERLGLKYRQQVDLYIAAYGISRQRSRVIDAAITLDKRFWRFVGYWLAEGCVGMGRTERTHTRITFNAKERQYVDDIRLLFEDYGCPILEYKTKSNTVDVGIVSKQLGRFLLQFGCGAHSKALPEWAIRLPAKFLREVITGYWRGDGSLTGNCARISSVSLPLMSTMQRALMRLGTAAGVMRCKSAGTGGAVSVIKTGMGAGRTIRASDCASYELRIDLADVPWLTPRRFGIEPRWKANKFTSDGKQLNVRIARLERKSYSGKVYDLETPCHDFVCGLITAHNCDISGHIITHEAEYEHLLIPMEWDGRRYTTSIGWTDPREEFGELAWPERYPEETLTRFRRNPFLWAGQYQQSPEPRGGGLIKRQYWQYEDIPMGKSPPPMEYIVASLDSAYTKQERNDPSGFSALGIYRDQNGNPKVMLLASWRKHLEIHGPHVDRKAGESERAWVDRAKKDWGLVEWVAYECKRLRVDRLLIEAKASGHSVAQEMQRLYANDGWGVELVDPEGDKYARAVAVIHLWSDGFVHVPASRSDPDDPDSLVPRDWADVAINDCAVFPHGRYRDIVDSLTQALRHLRNVGLAVRREEREDERIANSMHREKLAPLYPV